MQGVEITTNKQEMKTKCFDMNEMNLNIKKLQWQHRRNVANLQFQINDDRNSN